MVPQSTGFPWPLFKIISGAKYSWVPHNVYSFMLSKYFAKPKSVNFKYPFLLIRIFSGFKSL